MAADITTPAPPHRRHQWRAILRPHKCTKAATERVLSLARHGHSLREIAARNGMPTVDTLCRWIEENENFRTRYDAMLGVRDRMLADEAPLLKARERRLRVAILEGRIPRAPTTDAESEAEAVTPSRAREEMIAAHLQAVLDGKFDSPRYAEKGEPRGADTDA